MNESSSDILTLLSSINSQLSSVLDGLVLDATQFEQIMTLQTSLLIVNLFILAFVILFFGAFLGLCFFKLWRP